MSPWQQRAPWTSWSLGSSLSALGSLMGNGPDPTLAVSTAPSCNPRTPLSMLPNWPVTLFESWIKRNVCCFCSPTKSLENQENVSFLKNVTFLEGKGDDYSGNYQGCLKIRRQIGSDQKGHEIPNHAHKRALKKEESMGSGAPSWMRQTETPGGVLAGLWQEKQLLFLCLKRWQRCHIMVGTVTVDTQVRGHQYPSWLMIQEKTSNPHIQKSGHLPIAACCPWPVYWW